MLWVALLEFWVISIQKLPITFKLLYDVKTTTKYAICSDTFTAAHHRFIVLNWWQAAVCINRRPVCRFVNWISWLLQYYWLPDNDSWTCKQLAFCDRMPARHASQFKQWHDWVNKLIINKQLLAYTTNRDQRMSDSRQSSLYFIQKSCYR